MTEEIRVTQELPGGWTAVLAWNGDRPVQRGPSRVVVAFEGDDEEPVGGISSSVLREIDLRAANVEARKLQPETNDQRGYGLRTSDVAELIEADGISDTVLVLVCVLYAVMVEDGQPRVVARIAEGLDRKEVTVRSWLTAARRKGLFTGAAGKAGGRLTDEGLRLVRAYTGER